MLLDSGTDPVAFPPLDEDFGLDVGVQNSQPHRSDVNDVEAGAGSRKPGGDNNPWLGGHVEVGPHKRQKPPRGGLDPAAEASGGGGTELRRLGGSAAQRLSGSAAQRLRQA